MLANITISEPDYTYKSSDFLIKNEQMVAYNGVDEGLSNKICGIKIFYNGHIRVKNIQARA